MGKKGGDEARLSDLQEIERRQRKSKAAVSVSGCSESWCTVAWEKAAPFGSRMCRLACVSKMVLCRLVPMSVYSCLTAVGIV